MAITRNDDGFFIKHGKGENDLTAFVPAGADCIVEWITPCRVENPLQAMTLKAAIALVRNACEARTPDLRFQLAEVKGLLAGLNRQTLKWRKP